MAVTRKKERKNHCAIELIHFHCHYPFEWPTYKILLKMVYWNITQVVILLFLFSFPFHITSIPTPCNYTFGSIEHITYWPLYVAWQHHGLTLFLLFYIFCFFTPPFSILTHKHTYIYSNVLRWLFSQISITFILVLLSFFSIRIPLCLSLSHLLFLHYMNIK